LVATCAVLGLLGDNQSNSAMSTGITKILKENENQWINADVTDYSLSSLLGHLDCPSKTNQSMVSMSNDDTHLSQDVSLRIFIFNRLVVLLFFCNENYGKNG
jgi:hypothetical protein